MAHDLDDLGPGMLAFLAERHLATLATLRPDGSPHVVPVGVTFDPATATARVITSGTSAKARHIRDGQRRGAVLSGHGRSMSNMEWKGDRQRPPDRRTGARGTMRPIRTLHRWRVTSPTPGRG